MQDYILVFELKCDGSSNIFKTYKEKWKQKVSSSQKKKKS